MSAEELYPDSEHGVETFSNKLRVAMNKDDSNVFYSYIARYQRGLGN